MGKKTCSFGDEIGVYCRKLATARYVVVTMEGNNPNSIKTEVEYVCEDHLDALVLLWARGGKEEKIAKEHGLRIVSRKLFPVHTSK